MDRAILLVGRMKNNQVDEIRLNIRESKKCYKNNDLYLALEYYVKALGYVGNNLPEKDAYISAINDCLNNFSYEVLQ
ncbi:MAG: hypothetical protein IJV11_11560, partial [Muribaculaceae bacterium]|nr:hypothetical protein [Muribaculaceae bacterium]